MRRPSEVRASKCGCLPSFRSRPISSPPVTPPSPASTSSSATVSPANIAARREELTFDHVVPRSKGARQPGKMSSRPVPVAICARAIGCRIEAHMWPARHPYQPTVNDLHQNGRLFPPNYLSRQLDGLSLLGFGARAVRPIVRLGCENAPKRDPASNGDHRVGFALRIGILRRSASAPIVTLHRLVKTIATSIP